MKMAFRSDKTLVWLKIIGHIRCGLQVGVDKYGRCWTYCFANQSASEYNPELDGPIKFDV